MYYVSYITEYPIYEPAEGGYYYAGTQIKMCREFSTWKKANRFYQKVRREFLDMYERFGQDRVHDFACGGCSKWCNPCVRYNSRYIGEGAVVQLTRERPTEEGWRPYC